MSSSPARRSQPASAAALPVCALMRRILPWPCFRYKELQNYILQRRDELRGTGGAATIAGAASGGKGFA